MICNRDCFNCLYTDCIKEDISDLERINSKQRDDEIVENEALTYKKKYYWENHEKSKKWARDTYNRHKEEYQQKNREYYHTHKERARELNKRWQEEHRELLKERRRRYYLNWKAKKERLQMNDGGRWSY